MKLRFPFLSFSVSLILQFVSGASGGVFADLLFTVWTVAYLPTASFFYAKKYLPGGKRCVPFTLLHSSLLTLSFFVFYMTREGLLTALILFVWCEMWALIGLIRKQKIPCF